MITDSTLKRYQQLLIEIDELETEKDYFLSSALKGQQITDMPHGGGDTDRIFPIIERREKHQELIDRKLDELLAYEFQIVHWSKQFDLTDREIIYKKYINGEKLTTIAKDNGISYRQILRRHKAIINSL